MTFASLLARRMSACLSAVPSRWRLALAWGCSERRWRVCVCVLLCAAARLDPSVSACEAAPMGSGLPDSKGLGELAEGPGAIRCSPV